MNKIVIDKELLQSLVSPVPKSAVVLHQAYIEANVQHSFAAVDQIETALAELVADQRILMVESADALGVRDDVNMVHIAVPVYVYYVE